MRAEADRCRDNDVEAISRPGQVLRQGLQLPGLSFKVRHDVEVVVAAEHEKPVLQCEGRAGSRTHSCTPGLLRRSMNWRSLELTYQRRSPGFAGEAVKV